MINKLKEINWKLFGIIIFGAIILCNAFLQMHYSSDTYVLFNLGYFKYPSQYFLLDGRLISTLVCYIAGILNIPFKAYIIGMDILGVIFISISIYILYTKICNISKETSETSIIKKTAILCSCFVLVLNQFSLEFLLFPESGIMCLAQLLCVIASVKIISADRFKYLKVFLLLFFATFCYQGVLNIFPILVITLIFINQMYVKGTLKSNLSDFIKKISILTIFIIIIMSLNLISIKIGSTLLNNSSNRTIQFTNITSYITRLKIISKMMMFICSTSVNMLPYFINYVILLITLILLILSKVKKEIILKYLFILFCIILVCAIPMFFFNTGYAQRVNVPIAEFWGISLLFLIFNTNDYTEKSIKNIICIFVFSSFIINSIFIIRNSSEHIAANKIDQNMGANIKYLLDKYEKESGITVTKFAYIFDSSPQQYANGIKPIVSLTERSIACPWCISSAINFYCQRKLKKVQIPMSIYNEKIPKLDYKNFSEEQVIFDGDTLYLYVF